MLAGLSWLKVLWLAGLTAFRVRPAFLRRRSRMRGRIVAFAPDTPESSDEFGAGTAQLLLMVQREFAQYFFAFWSQSQQHLAAVVLGAGAMHEAARFQPVDQLHGAVMADLHAIG